jgi:hypothetical protein
MLLYTTLNDARKLRSLYVRMACLVCEGKQAIYRWLGIRHVVIGYLALKIAINLFNLSLTVSSKICFTGRKSGVFGLALSKLAWGFLSGYHCDPYDQRVSDSWITINMCRCELLVKHTLHIRFSFESHCLSNGSSSQNWMYRVIWMMAKQTTQWWRLGNKYWQVLVIYVTSAPIVLDCCIIS